MRYSRQQIGWSTTAKLLQQISKALDRAIKVTGSGTPATTSTTTSHP